MFEYAALHISFKRLFSHGYPETHTAVAELKQEGARAGNVGGSADCLITKLNAAVVYIYILESGAPRCVEIAVGNGGK